MKEPIVSLSIMMFCAMFFLLNIPLSSDAADLVSIPQPGNVQIVITIDGSSNIGRITGISANDVTFSTTYGPITIPLTDIKSIREVPAETIHNGEYWFPDPNETRLFFAPTGRMLEKNKGYFADYYIFFPTVNYGISDRISLGGGFSIIPSGSLSDQVFYFTPKVALKHSGNLNIAAGALILKFPDFSDDEDSPLISVAYSVGTYGTSGRSVTFGIGYGLVDLDIAEKPLIVIGGEQRLTRRMAVVTENWIVPGSPHPLVSLGIRFMSEELSFDLALVNTLGKEAFFPGVPYIDFVYNF